MSHDKFGWIVIVGTNSTSLGGIQKLGKWNECTGRIVQKEVMPESNTVDWDESRIEIMKDKDSGSTKDVNFFKISQKAHFWSTQSQTD